MKFKDYKILKENEGPAQGSTGAIDIDNDIEYDVTPDELHELISYIIETSTQEELNDVADELLDFIDTDDDREMYEEGDMSDEELEEARGRRFTGKKKGNRKFGGAGAKTMQQLKRDKVQNKTANRKKRLSLKAYKRKNKVATKKYAKSYSDAVKAGRHVSKKHRG